MVRLREMELYKRPKHRIWCSIESNSNARSIGNIWRSDGQFRRDLGGKPLSPIGRRFCFCVLPILFFPLTGCNRVDGQSISESAAQTKSQKNDHNDELLNNTKKWEESLRDAEDSLKQKFLSLDKLSERDFSKYDEVSISNNLRAFGPEVLRTKEFWKYIKSDNHVVQWTLVSTVWGVLHDFQSLCVPTPESGRLHWVLHSVDGRKSRHDSEGKLREFEDSEIETLRDAVATFIESIFLNKEAQ